MRRVNLNIPVTNFRNVLSWNKEQIDHLVDRAIDIAVRIGIRIDDDHDGKYLNEVQDKGAKVDFNERSVKFTLEDIAKTIEVMKKTAPLSDPLSPLVTVNNRSKRDTTIGNGANLIFDWDSWEARGPSKEDLVDVCNWAQGCENATILYPPFMLKDINQYIEPLYNYALMSKYYHKILLKL